MSPVSMLKLLLPSLFLLQSFLVYGQRDAVKTFDIYGEFRPRFELRDGYRQLPSPDTDPTFFISSRSRISLNYSQKKAIFHFSGQDIRIWDQNEAGSITGSLGIFETYAKLKIKKNWQIKLGRQGVELDNGRLFSKANWSQSSRTHDGVRITFENVYLKNELMGFYNEPESNIFGTKYNSHFYKYLFIHHATILINPKLNLMLMNSFDGYQSSVSSGTIYVRGTSGGRITYESEKLTATLSGYYQYGQLNTAQKVSAYYFQPELDYQLKKLNIRLGMELLSGNDNSTLLTQSQSFSTLYGVAFKFMGHLNYFTSFPGDVNGLSLIHISEPTRPY